MTFKENTIFGQEGQTKATKERGHGLQESNGNIHVGNQINPIMQMVTALEVRITWKYGISPDTPLFYGMMNQTMAILTTLQRHHITYHSHIIPISVSGKETQKLLSKTNTSSTKTSHRMCPSVPMFIQKTLHLMLCICNGRSVRIQEQVFNRDHCP